MRGNWLETTDATVEAIVRDLTARGARHFIYTDIARDGMLEHLDAAGFKQVVDTVRGANADSSLIYSGGVTSNEDLLALRPYALEGAITGTALYDGRIDLAEAQRALAEAGA